MKILLKKTLFLKLHFELWLRAMYLAVLGCVLGSIASCEILTRCAFAGTFFLLPAVLLSAKKIRSVELPAFLLLAVCLIMASFAVLQGSGGNFSLSYYKKLILFSCTVMMLWIASAEPVSRKGTQAVLRCGVLCAVLLAAKYYLLGDRETYGGGIVLGFGNPNKAGMFLLHGWLYCIVLLVSLKQWPRKLLCGILSGAVFYLILLTKSRACLVSAGAMAGLMVLGLGKGSKMLKSRGMCLLITLLPLLAALVYEGFLSSDLAEYFAFFVGEGKKLSSRSRIWGAALDLFQASPMLGSYYQISRNTDLAQLHNTGLDVLVSYGIVVFAAYHALLYSAIENAARAVRSSGQRAALCAFFSVMVHGVFEASFVSGGTGAYLLSCGFLILARQK